MAVRDNPPLWLQNFRQASFRGVEFLIDNVDSQFGRRVVTHEYPQRDVPYSEDLGRKARRFTVTGYLVGGSYGLTRDKLITACEASGAGELIHPYQGTLQVVCEGVTVRERRQDGGYCELALTFVEDGENIFPSSITNPATAVNSQADRMQGVLSDIFSEKYNLSNLPEFVRTEMTAAAKKLYAPLTRLVSQSNDFADVLTAFDAGLHNFISQPATLAAEFLNVIRKVSTLVGLNKSSSASLHDMALTTLDAVPSTTGTRARQSNAQSELQAMVQGMAAAEHSRVVSEQPYESYQEAQTARDQLTDEIDMLSETANDEVFYELVALRAKVVQALPDPRLPEIQNVTMRQSVPAVVLAYQVYGDPLRDADIVARNKIKHPGFISGGSTVEVVING